MASVSFSELTKQHKGNLENLSPLLHLSKEDTVTAEELEWPKKNNEEKKTRCEEELHLYKRTTEKELNKKNEKCEGVRGNDREYY